MYWIIVGISAVDAKLPSSEKFHTEGHGETR